MTKRCRVCERTGARSVVVRVSTGKTSREWRLSVCTWCWRAYEAMLDQGGNGVQQVLGPSVAGSVGWLI